MANMNNGFIGYQPTAPVVTPQMTPQQQVMQQPVIQNGGVLAVKTRDEAFNFPVAYGTSVMFKLENQPFIFVKTVGFSQLEQPRFDTYKKVEEGEEENSNNSESSKYDEIKDEISNLREQIDILKNKIDNRPFNKPYKKNYDKGGNK